MLSTARPVSGTAPRRTVPTECRRSGLCPGRPTNASGQGRQPRSRLGSGAAAAGLRGSSAVAFLELLARAAPAGVVAAELVARRDCARCGRDRRASREDPARGHGSTVAAPVACGGPDRLRSGEWVVVVG